MTKDTTSNVSAADILQLAVTARECSGPLSNVRALALACEKAVEETELEMVIKTSYSFTPHGATVVLILAQSHLVIATWPEHRLALVDLTMCGPKASAMKLWRQLSDVLRPAEFDIAERTVSFALQAAR